MDMDFSELSERPRGAILAMTLKEEVERAYRESVRNLSIEQIQALEKNPMPEPDDNFLLWPKALFRKLASFSGVFYAKDALMAHPV